VITRRTFKTIVKVPAHLIVPSTIGTSANEPKSKKWETLGCENFGVK